MRVNRISRARRRAALGLSLAALAAGVTTGAGPAVAQPKAAAAPAPNCSAAYRIEQKLATGTTWRMCWRFNSTSGLVLEDISYQPPGEAKPIKVLNSAKLGPDPCAVRRRQRRVQRRDGVQLRQRPAEHEAGRVPGRHHQDRQGPRAHVLQLPGRQGPVRHDPFPRPRVPPADRAAERAAGKVYQAQGKDLLLYTINKVELVRVHHRVAVPGRRHPHHERRRHRQPLTRRLRRRRRPWLAHRQGRQGLRRQPQPQRLLAARLRPRRLLQDPGRAVRLEGQPAPPATGGPTNKTTPHEGHQGTRGRRQEHALVADGQRDGQEQGRARRGPTRSCRAPRASTPAGPSPSTTCTSPSTTSASSTPAATWAPAVPDTPRTSTSGSTGRPSPTPWSG